MNTAVIALPQNLSEAELECRLQAPAAAIRAGRLVAFPTETVYGLGANALDPQAVNTIFAVKGRPQDNPLIVHLASLKQLSDVATAIPDEAYRLFQYFSPGPLTLVLQRQPGLPDVVTAGLDTVGIRFPEHRVARALIRLSRCPIAAPSANLSGKPSPTLVQHVCDDLAGKIPYILDGGACAVGLESTVLDLSHGQPRILRPGAISREQIEAFLGVPLAEFSAHDQGDLKHPAAPGMKYKHYAPQAPVCLIPFHASQLENHLKQASNYPGRLGFFVDEDGEKVLEKLPASWSIRDLSTDAWPADKRLGYFVFRHGVAEASHFLFAAFRRFDAWSCDYIFAQALRADGPGRAYMNRLSKAAAGRSL